MNKDMHLVQWHAPVDTPSLEFGPQWDEHHQPVLRDGTHVQPVQEFVQVPSVLKFGRSLVHGMHTSGSMRVLMIADPDGSPEVQGSEAGSLLPIPTGFCQANGLYKGYKVESMGEILHVRDIDWDACGLWEGCVIASASEGQFHLGTQFCNARASI